MHSKREIRSDSHLGLRCINFNLIKVFSFLTTMLRSESFYVEKWENASKLNGIWCYHSKVSLIFFLSLHSVERICSHSNEMHSIINAKWLDIALFSVNWQNMRLQSVSLWWYLRLTVLIAVLFCGCDVKDFFHHGKKWAALICFSRN